VLHISIWGSKLSLGAKWLRDWILGPCDSVPPLLGGMECGWYGSACLPYRRYATGNQPHLLRAKAWARFRCKIWKGQLDVKPI